MSRTFLFTVTCLFLTSCSGSPPSAPQRDTCGPYPEWTSSPYVLPYPAGTAFTVTQANCTQGGHQGWARHSYDFDMAIGTLVTAARAGRVVAVIEHFSDSTTGMDEANVVQIEHDDGGRAEYGHLTRDGALVEPGDLVVAGDPIGRSGNSGYTGGSPHLHFHVRACPTCDTIPLTFSNTDANPTGLQAGRSYLAQGTSHPGG